MKYFFFGALLLLLTLTACTPDKNQRMFHQVTTPCLRLRHELANTIDPITLPGLPNKSPAYRATLIEQYKKFDCENPNATIPEDQREQ